MSVKSILLWEKWRPKKIEDIILAPRIKRQFEAGINWPMQIIAKRVLRKFWEAHNQAEAPLKAWYALVDKADWSGPQDVKDGFGTTVDFVSDNRIIFDIGGNKYRLIVHVAYRFKRVLIKFVGTHEEYNRINPETV